MSAAGRPAGVGPAVLLQPTQPGGGAWRAILLVPWQSWRNRGRWAGVLLAALLVIAAPPLAGVLVGALRWPGRVVGTVLLIELVVLLCLVWVILVHSLLQQNQPQLARLLPGQVQRLRQVLWSALASLTATMGLLLGLAWGHTLAWTVAAALLLTLLAACVKRPALRMMVPVLAMALPLLPHQPEWLAVLRGLVRPGGQAPAAGALAAPAGDGVVVALAVALAMLMLATWRGFLEPAGPTPLQRHARRQQCGQRMGQGGSGPDLSTDPGAAARTWPQALRPTQWGHWAYQAWWRRLMARPGSATRARLVLGLGELGHWTTRLVGVGVMLGLMGLVLVAMAALSPELAEAMRNGLSIALLMVGLNTAQQLPSALWARRREQALLRLLPGAPPGPRFNAWCSRWLMGQYLQAWLLGTGALALCLAVGLLPSRWGLAANTLWALVIVSPLTGLWLWRDWARFAPRDAAYSGTLLLWHGALGLVAWLWVAWWQAPLWALLATVAVVGVALARWRWQRGVAAPPAWPVGHAAEQLPGRPAGAPTGRA